MPSDFNSKNLHNPATYSTSIGNLLRNYSYKVEVTLEHQITEEQHTQFITVSSNEVLTEEQIIGTATEYAESGNYGDGTAIAEMNIVDAYRSKELGEI